MRWITQFFSLIVFAIVMGAVGAAEWIYRKVPERFWDWAFREEKND